MALIVNQLRMPLYTIAVVDAEGHGQPVAHALVSHENQQHIEQFLHDVLRWSGGTMTPHFITDIFLFAFFINLKMHCTFDSSSILDCLLYTSDAADE